MSEASLPLFDEEVAFDRDLHAYRDTGGQRRMSVTQAIQIAGGIDYSMVPATILVSARSRGQLVHQATAIIDRGDDLTDFEIPEEIEPYLEAYMLFQREMRFVADPEWVERPMIVEIFGSRVGMTPDAFGTMDGVPTLIERKATVASHPCWQIQTAGYDLGMRAAGVQVRQRFALQLLRTGRYKLHPHEDEGDFDSFGDCYRWAAWKLKHRLAELD